MLTCLPPGEDKKLEARMTLGAVLMCVIWWVAFGILVYLLHERHYLLAFLYIMVVLIDWRS